ncbi:MAG: UDP-N-acetylmuramoyl-L-alanine--D-glutamate ligase [Gemmatimonadetes bacterium]|nr:UDP-N-acetylmuramoyl-L-alanine--D-glutamate ligase [Gemmatimonadota bacterium]NIQ55585.1 UDP-N-acetylmuramoyl-L-alanine--D-glutamate ligase [Gemmatimonadota bacterium]NIU75789.1 UDP-N-acetylmuramoyl-L-alanine--D-glutamate ligase [Gammaproteobacteria bacterium]NIX45434.1 UDP-N-acetylmuramoyl-L-alanine--D-glutamate ligase [Gemmatimonadota bacterium]NIY09723.1 UDP-N-acetylmuramoyl-L-alanine--D-glutamate ligase [Gemmatimonadota bacterium]
MTAPGRVGVVGLARSGRAAARLALATGSAVFVSDAGSDELIREGASEIRRLGGTVETGGHTVERLAECDLLVVSPGIPPSAPVLSDERLKGLPWTSELEFASRHIDAPLVAVTGTNGKTTVTAWITHLLVEAGVDAVAAGNIGTPLSDVALRDPPPEWVVVEASSYQLGRIETFEPRIGVVTNLAPDHLDRYPDVESYYADKARLFDNARPHSTWVLNGEDDAVLRLAGDAPGRRLLFRIDSEPPAGERGAWRTPDGQLMLRVTGKDEVLVRENDLKLLGGHNCANALAAALAAYAVTGDVVALRAGLRSFPPLRHRLEPLGEVDGVLWVNDSKATNVASARVAITSMDRPAVVLMGGQHKGESYEPLADALVRHARAVVAYGEAAERIDLDLAGRVPVEVVRGTFRNAVVRAAELAVAGDAVLLAPACASFDMFRDYEERGRRFEGLMEEIANPGPGGERG